MQLGCHNQSINLWALRGAFLKAGFMWFAVFMLVISLLVSSVGWAAAPLPVGPQALANMVEFYGS